MGNSQSFQNNNTKKDFFSKYYNVIPDIPDNRDILFSESKTEKTDQSYLNTILSELKKSKDDQLYFFVFENDFRKRSKVVDSSSRDSNYIKNRLDLLSSSFIPKTRSHLYIIEMYMFSNYSVIERGQYSKLILKTN